MLVDSGVDVGSLGAGIMCSCELPDEDAESQTQVQFKHYKLLSAEPAAGGLLGCSLYMVLKHMYQCMMLFCRFQNECLKYKSQTLIWGQFYYCFCPSDLFSHLSLLASFFSHSPPASFLGVLYVSVRVSDTKEGR